MPIYEFYCPDNNKLYSFLARTLSLRDKLPSCPDGESLRMERRVSRFAVIGKAKEDTGDDPFAGIDEDKMDDFMMDMERDMESLDENNPDPRQLGRFMRKMTDMMGDKTPPELREMVRRLESGEDPEKLEEEFGGGGEGDEAGDAIFSQMLKRARLSRKEPVRDPKLYEMRDFVKD
ncbi:MAG: cytochrome C [Prosthecobacter sp.]